MDKQKIQKAIDNSQNSFLNMLDKELGNEINLHYYDKDLVFENFKKLITEDVEKINKLLITKKITIKDYVFCIQRYCYTDGFINEYMIDDNWCYITNWFIPTFGHHLCEKISNDLPDSDGYLYYLYDLNAYPKKTRKKKDIAKKKQIKDDDIEIAI